MRVGFDSDGVLDNFGEGVRQTLEAVGKGHIWKSGPTELPFWNFYEDWSNEDGTRWTFEQFKELVDYGVDKGIIFSGHWREHAIDAIRKVAELGHQIIIVTDRSWGSNPLNSQANTVEAYRRAGIEYDELWFSRDKTVAPTDTFVEDKLENYDALTEAGVKAFLINRPWNQVKDARNRINCVCEYADAVEAITLDGFADLSLI